MALPKDRDARNALPVWDGCVAYFPDVWAEVAKVSAAGNKQHGLGAKLHWNTHVSTDHKNKAFRHMLDDTNGEVFDGDDGTMHLAKALWRIAAALQIRCWERDGKDEHGQPKARPSEKCRTGYKTCACPICLGNVDIEAEFKSVIVPKAGIRDTSQPVPDTHQQIKCLCGARVFAYQKGDLEPEVFDPSDLIFHSPTRCSNV